MPKTNNKSKRIRTYLETKPDAGNGEILEALGKFGVKYHDITNVRASQRKKEHRLSDQNESPRRGRPPKGVLSPAGSSGFSKAYDTALQLVTDAGSIDSAIEVLQVIRKIANTKLF